MKGADIHSYPQPPAEDVSEAEAQERSRKEDVAEGSVQEQDGSSSSAPAVEG